jgi:hypothetical protein
VAELAEQLERARDRAQAEAERRAPWAWLRLPRDLALEALQTPEAFELLLEQRRGAFVAGELLKVAFPASFTAEAFYSHNPILALARREGAGG